MLNKKVFSRLGLCVPENVIKDLSDAKPGVIEIFLFNLRLKIDEELEARQKNQSQSTSSPQQSLLSLNNLPSTDDIKPHFSTKTSRPSVVNPRDKWVSRLDYEDLKQQCLQLQEENEIFQARLRRLEHVVQLKELRINELSAVIEDYRKAKPSIFHTGTYKKKTN